VHATEEASPQQTAEAGGLRRGLKRARASTADVTTIVGSAPPPVISNSRQADCLNLSQQCGGMGFKALEGQSGATQNKKESDKNIHQHVLFILLIILLFDTYLFSVFHIQSTTTHAHAHPPQACLPTYKPKTHIHTLKQYHFLHLYI
jgi:hypothetical protein